MRGITIRVTLIAILALLVVAPSASASQNQTVTFEAPRDLLSAKHRASAFNQLNSLGVRSIRVVMYWKDVAPSPLSRVRPNFDATDPAGYNWSKYAPAIEEANRRGWTVLLTISGPVPLWASNGATSETYEPRPNEYQSFVTAVSRRFEKFVTRYSLYNEPNHPKFLTPQFDASGNPMSPKLYRGLVMAGLRGLDENHDKRPVLMGETSPRGTSEGVAPLLFLRETLCLDDAYRLRGDCTLFPVDGWATHPYTGRTPFLRRVAKDDVTIGTLGRLSRALDKAAAAGVLRPNLPIYLTEFGMQSTPDPNYGLSPLRQAEYRAIGEQIAWDNPRVASFAQYLLRDDLPRKGKKSERFGGFETGLMYSNGRIKPSLAAFRLPLTVTKKGRAASIWGCVRPGTGRRTAMIQVSDGGKWSKLATVSTDANGYFGLGSSFKRGRKWRVRATVGARTFTGPPTRAYKR